MICMFTCSQLLAQLDRFQAGTAIADYGKIAEVEGMVPIAKDSHFKVSFDVAKSAKPGDVNRSLDSVARFINMHVASGVTAEHIELAVVVHGSSVKEMTGDEIYQKNNQTDQLNANIMLIKELQRNGVKFYVCGQSATYYGVETKDLLPGVNMSLSAMTAHALLQQQGYSLNPF